MIFNTSEINRILGIHRTSARRKEHEEIWAYLDKEEKTIRAYIKMLLGVDKAISDGSMELREKLKKTM